MQALDREELPWTDIEPYFDRALPGSPKPSSTPSARGREGGNPDSDLGPRHAMTTQRASS